MALSDRLGVSLSRVTRAVFPIDSTLPVLMGPVRGMRFRIAPGMGLTYCAPVNDPFQFRWFVGRVRRGAIVYDIGANCGQLTLLFSRLVGPIGHVYAFEPAPDAFRRLVANVRLNGLDNVTAREVAVADVAGVERLSYAADRATQAKLERAEPTYVQAGAGRVEVRSIALDGEPLPAPDFVKIDVEGGARLVLKGAARLLALSAPEIYIELHGPEEQQAVNESLIGTGFIVETLDGRRIEDATAQWATPLRCYKRRA